MTQPYTVARKSLYRPCILRPSSFTRRSVVTLTKMSNSNHQDELDAISQKKRILRTRVRKALKAMETSVRSQQDNAIQRIVLEAPWFRSCRRLCAYISCSALREVHTSKVLSEILQNPTNDDHMQMGKKLYIPRVEDKNSHMRMLKISCMDDLIANSMNILEPAPVDGDGNEREDVMQANEPVDLFLLPGLAFDSSGRCLGRGGGCTVLFPTNNGGRRHTDHSI